MDIARRECIQAIFDDIEIPSRESYGAKVVENVVDNVEFVVFVRLANLPNHFIEFR